MYSRRNFLMSLLLFVPALLAPSAVLKKFHANEVSTKNEKFVRQGWMLQQGDI